MEEILERTCAYGCKDEGYHGLGLEEGVVSHVS